MSTIFVGDVGTEIVVDCGIAVTNATVRKIIVVKPGGRRVRWDAVLESTNQIKYTTQVGDIDVIGDWSVQAYIELPSWKGYGTIAEFKVVDPI